MLTVPYARACTHTHTHTTPHTCKDPTPIKPHTIPHAQTKPTHPHHQLHTAHTHTHTHIPSTPLSYTHTAYRTLTIVWHVWYKPGISHIYGIPHVHLLEKKISLKDHKKKWDGKNNASIGSQDVKIANACFCRLANFLEKARCDHFGLSFPSKRDGAANGDRGRGRGEGGSGGCGRKGRGGGGRQQEGEGGGASKGSRRRAEMAFQAASGGGGGREGREGGRDSKSPKKRKKDANNESPEAGDGRRSTRFQKSMAKESGKWGKCGFFSASQVDLWAHLQTLTLSCTFCAIMAMGWQRFAGLLNCQISFEKEHCFGRSFLTRDLVM